MALSASTLATLMRSKLLADASTQAQDNAALTAMCDAIAEAVVEHVVAAGVVLPTALLAPPGTLGGPVTGTGSIQ